MKTFSSILPFTRRFGVRGVTCMTNGALGGGGGNNQGGNEKPASDARSAEKARWALCQELKDKPQGVSTANLVARACREWPGEFDDFAGRRRVMGALNYMRIREKAERIAPALWRCTSFSESGQSTPDDLASARLERDEYELVADQLVESGECCYAKVIGDAHRRGRWNNPDIVCAVVPNEVALENGFQPKLLAVEVKAEITATALFGGFAQACAYQGFAHMAYLVVPWCNSENIDRVMRLCQEHGVGLAFICEENGEKWLEIEISPRSQDPDPDQFAGFLNHLGVRRIEELRGRKE